MGIATEDLGQPAYRYLVFSHYLGNRWGWGGLDDLQIKTNSLSEVQEWLDKFDGMGRRTEVFDTILGEKINV
jgi:hypothetical protein